VDNNAYTEFLQSVSFTPTITTSTCLQCYLLVCMSHVCDHEALLARTVRPEIAQRVLKTPIVHRDAHSLLLAIDTLYPVIFNSIHQFQRTIDACLPQAIRTTLTKIKYMQLYIVAYQHTSLWRGMWVSVCPNSISNQLVLCVEAFVNKYPFDADSFSKTLGI
jgi:hypothetical protein